MLLPKRVSLLLVAANLAEVSAVYDALGFAKVETGDPGCVGYAAGETGVILANHAFARRCWGQDAAAALEDRLVPYVFLEEIESASTDASAILADVHTWFGTREQVVRTVAGPVVLVEVTR